MRVYSACAAHRDADVQDDVGVVGGDSDPPQARAMLTYLLIAAASVCWLGYGLLVSQLLISAPHVLLLPTALITAGVAARNHRRSRLR